MFLAIGAWRIARHGVLTRRMAALERLGAITTLCVDKTGTLTANRMSVREIFAGGRRLGLATQDSEDLPPDAREVIEVATLASESNTPDPMDRAVHEVALQISTRFPTERSLTLVQSTSVTEELPAAVILRADPCREGAMLAVKGAPEVVIDRCAMDRGRRAQALDALSSMAADGLRVLAVARRVGPIAELSSNPTPIDLELIGLLGFQDPIRPEVPGAVAECRAAGIRVLMITGDYPETVAAIRAKLGCLPPD